MSHVLAVLDALCAKHDTWFYRIRDHFKLHYEIYNIDLMIDGGHRVVVSSALTDDYVDVWCDTHDTKDDGVRVKKSALLEYLLYIIQEEYGD